MEWSHLEINIAFGNLEMNVSVGTVQVLSMVWKPVLENSEEMGVAINNSLILSFICDAVNNVALANYKYEIKPKNCLGFFFSP